MMNKTLLIVAGVAAIFFLSGCATNRYYDYPPRVRTGVSLVIHSGPGIVPLRHVSGRYYYRNPQGHIYWRGPGNRYYLDRQFVPRNNYNRKQYREWNNWQRRQMPVRRTTVRPRR